jgi:hypothetical protein
MYTSRRGRSLTSLPNPLCYNRFWLAQPVKFGLASLTYVYVGEAGPAGRGYSYLGARSWLKQHKRIFNQMLLVYALLKPEGLCGTSPPVGTCLYRYSTWNQFGQACGGGGHDSLSNTGFEPDYVTHIQIPAVKAKDYFPRLPVHGGSILAHISSSSG